MKRLLSDEQLEDAVGRMARFVDAEFPRPPLVVVGVLTGSLVLLADLIRRLDRPLRVALIQAHAAVGGGRGELRVNDRLLPELAGAHVLVVDDIYDTGHTLAAVISQLAERGPATLRSAVLLRKQGRREAAAEPDFVGFDIPDEYVVGYGLDYQDLYRNLPYVAALESGDMS